MAEATVSTTETHIEGLACIYVPVSDVYTSVQWYTQNLGLTPTAHNPVRPGMEHVILSYPSGGPEVFLIQASATTVRNFYTKDGYEKPLVCFYVRNIDEMHERMKANGVRLEGDSLEDRGACGTNFRFYDPDGNKFDVNQPADL